MRTMLFGIFATAFVVSIAAYADAQAPRSRPPDQPPPIAPGQVGRYQLLLNSPGTVYLVDTATGRIWRYTKLTRAEGSSDQSNPCTGLDTCFLEVDRLRLTDSGWVSEIVKGKP
jgi:hypothetical protein